MSGVWEVFRKHGTLWIATGAGDGFRRSNMRNIRCKVCSFRLLCQADCKWYEPFAYL